MRKEGELKDDASSGRHRRTRRTGAGAACAPTSR